MQSSEKRALGVARLRVWALLSAGVLAAPTAHAQDVYPVLDTEFYGWMNDDVVERYGSDPVWLWWHWGRAGRKEVRTSSPAFDTAYYLQKNPDVAEHFGSDIAAVVDHYLDHGVFEGRSASIAFDPVWYLNAFPDVANHFGSNNWAGALLHWLTWGIDEGRAGSRWFDPRYYLRNNPDVAQVFGATNYKAAIMHFMKHGLEEGRKGAPGTLSKRPTPVGGGLSRSQGQPVAPEFNEYYCNPAACSCHPGSDIDLYKCGGLRKHCEDKGWGPLTCENYEEGPLCYCDNPDPGPPPEPLDPNPGGKK